MPQTPRRPMSLKRGGAKERKNPFQQDSPAVAGEEDVQMFFSYFDPPVDVGSINLIVR